LIALPARIDPLSQRRKSPTPGHGFEGEAVNKAERDAEHTAQDVYADEARGDDDPELGMPASFRFSDTAKQVRQALRPGSGA
jgi:hypothetical protein